MQHKYFAASNSAEGFKNYYPEVFARADYIYIIKGGPGTGKSSLMKKYALRAEAKGHICEYYYCSSDPSSLDGVLMIGKGITVGILDGTAPHVSEPRFPGAREEIINLGQFWNSDLLKKQKKEIIALSERKSAEYKAAYTFLRSVGNLRAVNDGLIEEALDRDKMTAAVIRLLKDLPTGKMQYLPAILDSVSMNGRINFDTFSQNAEQLYVVNEFYGVGQIFLDEVFKELHNKNISARVSFDPISPEHIDGIFLENEKISFVTARNTPSENKETLPENKEMTFEGKKSPREDKEIIRINTKRFVDMEILRDVRSELRYTAHLAQSSLDGALHSLSKAKIYHFLLEDIYGKAMDWQRLAGLEINL